MREWADRSTSRICPARVKSGGDFEKILAITTPRSGSIIALEWWRYRAMLENYREGRGAERAKGKGKGASGSTRERIKIRRRRQAQDHRYAKGGGRGGRVNTKITFDQLASFRQLSPVQRSLWLRSTLQHICDGTDGSNHGVRTVDGVGDCGPHSRRNHSSAAIG